jgi:cytochrome P450
MLAEMAELTAAVISRAVFGGTLHNAAAAQIVRSFSAYQREVEQLDLLSLFGLPDYLPRWHSRSVRRHAASIHHVVDALLRDQLASGEPSIAHALATMLEDEALRDEATVLLMAGHETTANTLAWAWYCLSQDHESWSRLASEVDALGHAPSSLDDVRQLPFTRAVIDETLRLFPPVPILARRARAARVIAGRQVPAGSIVMLVPWLLHRHERYWQAPDLFDPGRFMPGGSGVPDRYAYIPFSIGPRICTGAAFALTETVIALATLARHVRPRLRPGHAVMPTCRLTLRPGDTLPMRLEPRL